MKLYVFAQISGALLTSVSSYFVTAAMLTKNLTLLIPAAVLSCVGIILTFLPAILSNGQQVVQPVQ